MKKYNFCIPVTGIISKEICSDSAEEAVNILMNDIPNLEYHPSGHLILDLSSMIVSEKETIDN